MFRSIHQCKLYWKKGKRSWRILVSELNGRCWRNWKWIHKQPKFLIWSISVKMVFVFCLCFCKFWLNFYISCTFEILGSHNHMEFSVIQYKVVDNLTGYCWFSILMTDLCLSWSRSGYMNIFCRSFCFEFVSLVLFRSHSDLFSSLLGFFLDVQLNAHFDLLSSSSQSNSSVYCVDRDLLRKKANWKQRFGLRRLHW